MDIRAASPADALAITEIHVAAWRSAYRGLVAQSYLDALSVPKRQAYWSRTIESGQPKVRVADSCNTVVGWVAFDRCRDSKAGFLPELESAKLVDIGGTKLQELRYARAIAA